MTQFMRYVRNKMSETVSFVINVNVTKTRQPNVD